jgi:hypothetical protein
MWEFYAVLMVIGLIVLVSFIFIGNITREIHT